MKVRLGTILLVLLCFAASGFSSSALGSVDASVGDVICYADGGWRVTFHLIHNLPLTMDDETGDYVAGYLYEDYGLLSIGVAADSPDGIYPFDGAITLLHSYASVVSVIVTDVTTWDISGPSDYDSVLNQDNVLASISASYDDYCDGVAETSEVSDAVMPPDERINWQYGDLNAVLYRGEDEQGNPALNLYCYDGETAWLGFQISSANMGDAPIEAEGCDVTFYILESGELQVNIRDAEGKWYEIICADLACEAPVLRYFDPNE